MRKQVAEQFLKDGEIWLAEHFLRTGLEAAEKMEDCPIKHRMEAEIHCILAFITRDNAANIG